MTIKANGRTSPVAIKGRGATGTENGSQFKHTGPKSDLVWQGKGRISRVDDLEQCPTIVGFQALILEKPTAFLIPNTVSVSN